MTLVILLIKTLNKMKTLIANGKLGRFAVNLPENLEEIGNDYFKECTDFIHPAKDYAVVAIVYKDSLNLVLTSAKKKQPAQLGIIPVFIKCGETNSDFINSLNLGDKVVVAASDLSIGHHINSPYNKITPDNIIRITEGDVDITKQSLAMTKPVCFVEFKLVPVSAIHAKLDKTANSFVNPFVTRADMNVAQA